MAIPKQTKEIYDMPVRIWLSKINSPIGLSIKVKSSSVIAFRLICEETFSKTQDFLSKLYLSIQ